MNAVIKLNLSEIFIPEGQRDIAPETVQNLAESIRTIGILNPLTVRRDGEQYVLIAGAHRLEAAKQEGRTEIECIVFDGDDLRCELAAIDENLIRKELHYIQIGELAIRRDAILTELGQRAKIGDNQHTKGGTPDSGVPRTTADIASEVGIRRTTLNENKQLARDLLPEVKQKIQGKDIPKILALEISRLKPEEQREVIARGDKKSIAVAVREVHFKAQRNHVPAYALTADSFDKAEIGGCTLYCGDALKILPTLDEIVIDAVVTDPPYGITAEEWDEVPPLDPMWEQLDAKTKATANFVMFAAGDFLFDLRNSNANWHRYNLIWNKNNQTGYLNSGKQPMRTHEDILVFGRPGFRDTSTYNPIKTPGGAKPGSRRTCKTSNKGIYRNKGVTSVADGTGCVKN